MRIHVLCGSTAAVLAAACSGSAPVATSTTTPVGSVAPGSGGALAPGDAGVTGDAGLSVPRPSPTGANDAGSDAGGASAVACPGIATWTPGTSTTISLDVGDAGARSYDVYVGAGVRAGTAVPLLVNMHGLTNSPAIQAAFSQMNPVADANGFVVVYPAGLGASFNAGSCCGSSSLAAVDDVGFVRAVVADAESKICIDPKRVYETGFSNGGMMAYELACNAADLFAAVAPTEGDNETSVPCHPSRAVPMAAFESLGDPIVTAVSAEQSIQRWAAQLGCSGSTPAQTMEAAFSCSEWSQCTTGAEVWYCTLPGGTHLPPAGSAPVVWSFLSRFTLP